MPSAGAFLVPNVFSSAHPQGSALAGEGLGVNSKAALCLPQAADSNRASSRYFAVCRNPHPRTFTRTHFLEPDTQPPGFIRHSADDGRATHIFMMLLKRAASWRRTVTSSTVWITAPMVVRRCSSARGAVNAHWFDFVAAGFSGDYTYVRWISEGTATARGPNRGYGYDATRGSRAGH